MADDLTGEGDPDKPALESTREFESETLRLVDRILLEMKPRLDEVGLSSRGPEVGRGDRGGYWSEVRLWFSTDDEPYDGIEFFVYEQGRKVTYVHELDPWLRTEIEGIVKARQSEPD